MTHPGGSAGRSGAAGAKPRQGDPPVRGGSAIRDGFRGALSFSAAARTVLVHGALMAAVLAGISPVAWAELPLVVELDGSSHISRSEGPIPLTLKIDWGGPGLLEGRLQIDVEEYRDRRLRVVTDELYLTEGQHRYRMLLPSLYAMGQPSQLLLKLTYIDGDLRQPLEPLPLRCPSTSERRLLVGVADDGMATVELDGLLEALNLTRLHPRPDEADLSYLTTRIPPVELPADPLRYCVYDILVVPPRGLAALSRKQARALTAWVKAGGSIVVLPEGRVQSHQFELLNALFGAGSPGSESTGEEDAEEERSGGGFTLDTSGRVVLPDEPPPMLRYVELGRAVIADPAALKAADFEQLPWRQAAAFLWRLRQDQLAAARFGAFDVKQAMTLARSSGHPTQWTSGSRTQEVALEAMALEELAANPVGGGGGMMLRLLPEGMQLVPLGLIALVLLLYLLAVGPFDYLLLGRLRQRKLTWVLFPVVTLSFAALAIGLSNAFMAGGDHRRALVLRDVGADGAVLRENRIEMLFTGRRRQITTDVRRSLVMPLNYQEFFQDNMWMYGYRYRYGEETLVEAATLTGRMPTQGSVVQQLPQWTPQMNRSLSIPLPDEKEQEADRVAGFDWSAPLNPASEPQLQALRTRVQAALGPEARVYLYQGLQRRTLAGPEHLFADSRDRGVQRYYVDQGWRIEQVDYLQSLSVRQQPGWFGFVSQASPGCGAALEDLTVLDPSDPGQYLLVIAVDQGEDLVVYRRVYR